MSGRVGRFNDRLATGITRVVSTMWCAYGFAGLALVSLPVAISGGVGPIVAWVAQTFLQLVLLSIIMVGQKLAATSAADHAAEVVDHHRTTHRLLEALHERIPPAGD